MPFMYRVSFFYIQGLSSAINFIKPFGNIQIHHPHKKSWYISNKLFINRWNCLLVSKIPVKTPFYKEVGPVWTTRHLAEFTNIITKKKKEFFWHSNFCLFLACFYNLFSKYTFGFDQISGFLLFYLLECLWR